MTEEFLNKVQEYKEDRARRAWVRNNFISLKEARGRIPLRVVALGAKVPQPLLSRIEHGNTHGVGMKALQRVLETYNYLKEVNSGTDECSPDGIPIGA